MSVPPPCFCARHVAPESERLPSVNRAIPEPIPTPFHGSLTAGVRRAERWKDARTNWFFFPLRGRRSRKPTLSGFVLLDVRQKELKELLIGGWPEKGKIVVYLVLLLVLHGTADKHNETGRQVRNYIFHFSTLTLTCPHLVGDNAVF